MKWLKSYNIFESNISKERIDEILDTIQYFLDEWDIFKSKNSSFTSLASHRSYPNFRLSSKEFINEWTYSLDEDKLVILIIMNRDLYPTDEKREKIFTLKETLSKSFLPMIEEKSKIEILEQKIDSWNYVPTGIRIEIEL